MFEEIATAVGSVCILFIFIVIIVVVLVLLYLGYEVRHQQLDAKLKKKRIKYYEDERGIKKKKTIAWWSHRTPTKHKHKRKIKW
jgi:hypothetical protein